MTPTETDFNEQEAPAAKTGPAETAPIPYWRVVVFGRRPRATLARILVLITLCFVAFHWMLFSVRVTGISMEPTFHNRSIRIVNRMAYRHADETHHRAAR